MLLYAGRRWLRGGSHCWEQLKSPPFSWVFVLAYGTFKAFFSPPNPSGRNVEADEEEP